MTQEELNTSASQKEHRSDMPSFIHLHVHSAYSLLEGAITLKDLLRLCKNMSMPAMALTDTNNMFGSLEFASTFSQAGIQPIIGLQISVLNPYATPETTADNDLYQPIVLLVQSEQGYKNLLKISSKSYVETQGKDPPHTTIKTLNQYQEGLICLSGGYDGPLGYLFKHHQHTNAHALAQELSAIFPSKFYLELTRHTPDHTPPFEPAMLDLAQKLELPIVATNDIYFATPNLHIAHDALLCVADGAYVSQDNRRQVTPEHYFKSSEEMMALFHDLPEACENTLHIAKRCHFFPKSHAPILPPFTSPSGLSEEEELTKQAYAGLEIRLKDYVFTPGMSEDEKSTLKKTYEDRLAYEIDVIIKMGFSGYFLIVSDFIKWAKNNNIPVGPGRGSGAGSATAWCLAITDIDPLRFSLIFERFLNPERVSMPDFDVDFCQERRDEVIRYVQKKYGADHVAQIITYGKLQARAVLRDVGRVLQLPYGQVDRICKLVPNNPANPVTLAEALKAEPKLQLEQENDGDVDHLIKISLQLEGLYRHASTHAAGIVIGDRPLHNLVPMYRDPKSPMLVTQFNMKLVEKAGLVKFDFLGLKTLTVIEKAAQLVRQNYKNQNNFDIAKIPLDDDATFKLLRRVETVGIFQLESAGMSDVVRQLQPETFDELIALVALYRPGPMDDIPRYIACRHGREPVTYMHPSVEPVLKESFGVMVYQEQVMWIARELAGYSLGDADLLRRAMGKKIKSEMDKQREIFINGCKKNGIDENLAVDIFDKIAKFASYAFPKAHAAPYALLSYQTAFLKANYPLEFYAATMTLDMHNTDKINVLHQDMKKLGFSLLPPDINTSLSVFSVEHIHGKNEQEDQHAVRYALSAIKSVGEAAMEEVITEREKNGLYTSIWNFMERLSTKATNKRQIESLIAAGAFDSLHKNRRTLLDNIETILYYGQRAREQAASSQTSLFGEAELPNQPNLIEAEPWGLTEKLEREFEALGFYLSAHPLDAYALALPHIAHQTSRHVLSSLQNTSDDHFFSMLGVVIGRNNKVSRKGNRFAFVQLSDKDGTYETTVFSDTLGTYSDLLEPGKAVQLDVTGRWDTSNDCPRLSINAVQDLEKIAKNKPHNLNITIVSSEDIQNCKNRVKKDPSGLVTVTLKLSLKIKGNPSYTTSIFIELPGRYTIKEGLF